MIGIKSNTPTDEVNELKIINQIRALGIDMISEANSGHPGIVLGAAPMIYSLYAHHLRFDREEPNYFNRDRFIMSSGHGSALLYSTLFMAGLISLEDVKKFRQIDSITPGHPEYKVTSGVEMTTGPLGQGFASAVGVAMGEAKLERLYNKGKRQVIDFNTYVLCGDGDLMEGVSYEAASLAGTLKLNKLIVLYDSNNISLDGKTSLTFTENVSMRFVAAGWNVITVSDGEDYKAIGDAIEKAKASVDKPTLIEVKTTIGKFSKLQGTNKVHGAPLDKKDITSIKKKMKLRDVSFNVSQDTIDMFNTFVDERCKNLSSKFDTQVSKLSEEEQDEIKYLIGSDKSIALDRIDFKMPEGNVESLRDTSGKILNSIVKDNNLIIGGSADLFGANKTYITDGGDFSHKNYLGKNIFFGVREHAMGSILNGLSLVGFRTYGSTFMAFSDYMKPAIRMAAMMNLNNTYIFTHDSISVGEDGLTHEPVEQLIGLRSIPNLDVYRPGDANEVIGVYKEIMSKKSGPSVISLSRNKLPILKGTKASHIHHGGYVVRDFLRKEDGIIISTGEELHLALEVAERLSTKGIDVRVVSMPNIKNFLNQSEEYIDKILPVGVRKIVIEAASSYSWNRIVFNSKYLITLDEFGCSGKKDDVYKKYGFDVDSLEERIENLLK